MVERLAKGMRRFIIAHELGHIFLWKTDGKSAAKPFVAWDSLEEFARIAKAPHHRIGDWAQECACDMLGLKLMQETSLTEARSDDEFSPNSHLPMVWDFASVHLWMTLWDHILHRMKLANQPVSDTHPPFAVRRLFLELAYPSWSQHFGKRLSDTLSYRMANL